MLLLHGSPRCLVSLDGQRFQFTMTVKDTLVFKDIPVFSGRSKAFVEFLLNATCFGENRAFFNIPKGKCFVGIHLHKLLAVTVRFVYGKICEAPGVLCIAGSVLRNGRSSPPRPLMV